MRLRNRMTRKANLETCVAALCLAFVAMPATAQQAPAAPDAAHQASIQGAPAKPGGAAKFPAAKAPASPGTASTKPQGSVTSAPTAAGKTASATAKTASAPKPGPAPAASSQPTAGTAKPATANPATAAAAAKPNNSAPKPASGAKPGSKPPIATAGATRTAGAPRGKVPDGAAANSAATPSTSKLLTAAKPDIPRDTSAAVIRPVAVRENIVRRDPFAPLIGKQISNGGGPVNLPPGKPGLLISSLRIDGIVSGPNGMIAIVSNAQDRVYFLREGDRLYDGQVEHITMDGISFHQAGKDPFGNSVEREVAKRLNSTPGEQQ